MDSVNNVTLRKHQLPKTRSLESLEHSNSMSPASYDDILGKSLDLSTNMCYSQIEELKSEIKQLKSQLGSTQNELDNIILENTDLKKQIMNMTQDLRILKQLCRSPVSTLRHNMSSSEKKSVRRRLTNSFSESPITLMKTAPTSYTDSEKGLNSKTTRKTDQISPKLHIHSDNIRNTCLESDNKPTPTLQPKKIYIFGTQQCSGLAMNLSKARLNTLYDSYDVTAFTKPFASTEEVLKCCDNFAPGKDDKIILGIAENDSNPMKIMMELSNVLKRLQNTTVVVLKVSENKYLNVAMLNNHLKLICKNYSNCYFFDNSITESFKTNSLCQKLNNYIDYLDYKHKYLISKNTNSKSSTKNNTNGSKKSHHNGIKNNLIQTRIIDYFTISKQSQLQSSQCNTENIFRG